MLLISRMDQKNLFSQPNDERHRRDEEVIGVRKLGAVIDGIFLAPQAHFETVAADSLSLDFEGIVGDFHRGPTRHSGSREPWYTRGTEMRNERQISIVSHEELSVVAARMGLPEIKPEWIGANIAIGGIPRLSMLPAGTILFFEGGATLKVDAQIGPCRIAGRQVALRAGIADADGASLLFPKVAKRLRGLVGWVEKPGTLCVGGKVSVRVPEQWIYRPD